MRTIEWEGLEELNAKLEKNIKTFNDSVRRVVAKQEPRMMKGASSRAVRGSEGGVFTGGYSGNEQSLGNIKNSLGSRYEDSGKTLVVGTTAEYGEYVEHGTRFMPPEPFMEPTLHEVEPLFKNELERIMK